MQNTLPQEELQQNRKRTAGVHTSTDTTAITLADHAPLHHRVFGFPALLVQRLVSMGCSSEEIKEMSLEQALERARPLEGATLRKTLETVFKTSHQLPLLLSRFELLFGPTPQEISSLMYVLHCTLSSCETQIEMYTGDLAAPNTEEFVSFLLEMGSAEEHRMIKLAARYILGKLSLDAVDLSAVLGRKLSLVLAAPSEDDEENTERHFLLFGGSSGGKDKLREVLSDTAETVAVAVQGCTKEVSIWPQVLSLYEGVGKHVRPEEKLRALGKAVLKSLQTEESVVKAAGQYVFSMRKKAHEVWYASFFISSLQRYSSPEAEKALRRLLVFLFTENSLGTRDLSAVGVTALNTPFLLSVLEEIKPERVNPRTLSPVLQNLIRGSKNNRNTLERIVRCIQGVSRSASKKCRSLQDTLNHGVRLLGEIVDEGVEEEKESSRRVEE